MDCLTLLVEARAAGLSVRPDGDRLVVRGPRSAGELAERLLGHKWEVLVWLSPRPKFALLGDGTVAPLLDGDELPAGTVGICAEGDARWARLQTPIPEADAGVTDRREAATLRRLARRKLRTW